MSISLSSSTPTAPSGKTLVTWQSDGAGHISGYVPTATTTEVKVNGTDVTTQTPINFQNGTNITVSNPSAGNIKIDGPSALPPNGSAGGDLTGSYPNPTIKSSVALSGSPTTTTQTQGDNSTKVATTAYVDTGLGTKQSTLTGTGIARNSGACSELSGDVTTSGSNATTIKSSVALAGSPTTTTQSSGDNSTKIATTAYVDAPVSGGTPIVNIPFGIGGGIVAEGVPGAASLGTSNNQMFFVYFVCPYDITLTNVYVSIGTGLTGASMGVAIYDSTGAKLVAADAFSVATNGIKSQALSASVTLKKKTGYFLGWTVTSSSTLTVYNILMGGTTGFQGLFNAHVIRSGTAAASTSGGTTLSNLTLGTVVSAQLRIPVLYFD